MGCTFPEIDQEKNPQDLPDWRAGSIGLTCLSCMVKELMNDYAPWVKSTHLMIRQSHGQDHADDPLIHRVARWPIL
jgi:hypothetical protein